MNLFLRFFGLKYFKLYPGFVLAFCGLCIGNFVLAQGDAPPVFKGKTIELNAESLKNKFRRFSAIQLESKKLSQLVHQNTISSFRLDISSDKQWDIDLEPAIITTANYHLKVLTPQGTQTLISHADFLYKGKVKGSNKDEQVRLAIKDGFIYGSIQTGGKEYFIEPSGRFTSIKQKDQYIIYEAKDAVSSEVFTCGVDDKGSSLKEVQQQNTLREQSPQDNTCKKIKFISVADYSIFQKFGGDIYAVEAALLANLNLAAGAFTTLNFGPDGSTDVGADELHFEMEEIVVPVCEQCDIVRSDENVGTVTGDFEGWIRSNHTNSTSKIFQFWTTRNLFLSNGGVVGYTEGAVTCSGNGKTILKYASDDPAFLRVLVAHETGHALSCTHDNDAKADVTGFIMYSGANGTRTRFSTLADFGGLNYSSQQTIRTHILQNLSCLEECTSSTCEEVQDLKINYLGSDDSVQISWSGSGNFLTKYKVKDAASYEPGSVKEVSVNNIILKKLEPCNLYQFEVQKICPDVSKGRISAIIFNSSILNTNVKPVYVHGNLYDLEVNTDCKHCISNPYSVKIDHLPYSIPVSDSFRATIRNLFADGARHRADISKDINANGCTNTKYFQAPYYRSNSSNILLADFNNCTFPGGWRDSVIMVNPSLPRPNWYIGESNFYTSRTNRGSLDSSCMIYYNSYSNNYRGALALFSPLADLTTFQDTYLHFDFNFRSYQAPNGFDFGSFWVEAFNGNNWEKIFEYTHNEPFPRVSADIKDLWDSIPQRVFISLDKYRNKNFQIRFIVDDGLVRYNRSGQVFAAFDNIQVDGYPAGNISNDFLIYPNPSKEEIFFQFTPSLPSNIKYDLYDTNGRVIQKGMLENYRISLRRLSAGMYFIRLYQNNQLIGTTGKIIKQ